jgi:hypothetical protein
MTPALNPWSTMYAKFCTLLTSYLQIVGWLAFSRQCLDAAAAAGTQKNEDI